MTKLTPREIDLLVNYYIGCEGGYLNEIPEPADLRAFLQVWCDLDINPTSQHTFQVPGEFVEILNAQPPQVQAKILRTVLASLPIDTYSGPHTRNRLLRNKLSTVADRLESSTVLVDNVSPKSAQDVVQVALKDADHLIARGSARSAVDRTHTALHGYLKEMCDDESIQYEQDSSLPRLFKLLQNHHSAFQSSGQHQEKIDNICKGLATAIHSLNEIRNQATPAHPNDTLLDVCDATLAINTMRTIFHFLEEKRSPRGQNLLRRILSRT